MLVSWKWLARIGVLRVHVGEGTTGCWERMVHHLSKCGKWEEAMGSRLDRM